MEAGNGGGGGRFPGKATPWIVLGTAAIGLVAAWVALQGDLFEGAQSRDCSMEGTVALGFATPAPGVQLGFAPSDLSVDFVPLTRTGSDGAFSGSCEAAQDATTGESFELLARGTFQGTNLPCLRVPVERTGVFVDREGESTGLRVEIRGC